ncbi:hypothetical protein [Clostridium sp. YIM B02506]|uniref:hypothetical protein n=1 Tax=Clostridium sp. YIM B02506 TaxID=2910680 RepID=UPI001EEE10DD|nr:hypothetical protein [Clostridium sp. YIM B02506]
MSKVVRDSLISALMVAIVSGLINILVAFWTSEQGIVRVNDTMKIEDNKYQLNIDIVSLGDYDLNKLRISIPKKIDLKEVKVNQPVRLTPITTNINGNYGDILEVDKVAAKQRIHIIFSLNEYVNLHDIVIDKNDNKVKVEYADEIGNTFNIKIVQILIQSLMFGILIFIIGYMFERRRLRYLEDAQEKVDEQSKQINDLKENVKRQSENIDKVDDRYEKIVEKYNKYEADSKKKQIILLSRLNEYKKELSFWRDTIRKILYRNGVNKENTEDIIDSITTNLKTYQTNSKNEIDFDTVNHLAKMLNKE